MRLTLPGSSEGWLNQANQWFYGTPERALERAYGAAIALKELENQHYSGQPIGADSAGLSPSVNRYFSSRRDQLLREARIGLAEFRWATTLLGNRRGIDREAIAATPNSPVVGSVTGLLAKLATVDQMLVRYDELFTSQDDVNPKSARFLGFDRQPNQSDQEAFKAASSTVSPSQKTGIIPRSILRTGRRLKRDLDPKQEDRVLEEYQISSYRTKRAVRFLLVLVLIPLLTQQVSKRLIFAPVVELIAEHNHIELPLNDQLEREAIEEIDFFEKQLRFEANAGIIPPIAPSDFREIIEEKTHEITHEFSHERLSALENVFADLLAAGVFAWILFANPRAVKILKSFMDDIVYGLSDSAKAFLIIVATDMFVGFHSTHGWEVLLEGVAHHLGLPENRDFIYLFIATFPVVLDAIFKYWIFRYLSRVSPSAVATYRNMNE